MTTNETLTYQDGTVDVPHIGVTLRSIFGAAAAHNIARDGRQVKITLRGVKIGSIQLKDAHLKGIEDASTVRKTVHRS